MFNKLRGKYTWFAIAGVVLYAVGGLMSGNLDFNEAFKMLEIAVFGGALNLDTPDPNKK